MVTWASGLRDDHEPDAIRRRLAQPMEHNHLGDAILGAMDGIVTTFAVVAGAVGAGFPALIATVLGLANLVADGFSMAVGNYQATRAQRDLVSKARASELRHIAEVPEGERQEVRQIYANKGFDGELLEQIVDTITSDRELWVDTMLREELGLQLETATPMRSATTTFVAFVTAGFLPLCPLFLLINAEAATTFALSAVLSGIAFFAVGIAKGRATETPVLRSGLVTLATGGTAAALAYGAGFAAHWALV